MDLSESRQILGLLSREGKQDVRRLWSSADPSWSSDQFRRYVIDGYPDVVLPYSATAADVGVDLYESYPTTTSGFVAVPGELPPVARLESSASWALDNFGEGGLDLLSNSAVRAIFDGMRSTILTNVGREGGRWSRQPSFRSKCGFCRMLATRDNYLSEASAGFKAHDSCACMPVPARPGGDIDRPAYIEKWQADYYQIRRDTGSRNPKIIAAEWDRRISSEGT